MTITLAGMHRPIGLSDLEVPPFVRVYDGIEGLVPTDDKMIAADRRRSTRGPIGITNKPRGDRYANMRIGPATTALNPAEPRGRMVVIETTAATRA